tara:strand:+ start:686 stop:1387 length:702 start_codon:yes stop_codon:yes gene_type:complete
MKVMISQPTFFPWIGYFDMISQSDIFIILDDVKFSYQSWQHRNKFKTPKGLEFFTIPVASGKKFTNINKVKLNQPEFTKNKFQKFIISNYNKSKYFKLYDQSLNALVENIFSQNYLLNFNVEIIKWLLSALNLKINIKFSSEMNIKKNNIERILEICKKVGAKEYISTIGAKDYLKDSIYKFDEANIKLTYHNYKHPKYNQLFQPFLEYACSVDLIFNEGPNSLKIIKSGRSF